MADKNGTEMLNKGVNSMFWLRIFLSPFIAGLLAGGIALLALRGTAGIVLAGIAAIAGAFIGYRMAESARKTTGASAFMARNMTNTEFTDNSGKS